MKNQKIIIAIIIVIIISVIVYFLVSSKKSQRVLEPKESENNENINGINDSTSGDSGALVSSNSNLFITDIFLAKLYAPTSLGAFKQYNVTPQIVSKVNSEGGKISFTGGTWYSYFGIPTLYGAISGQEPNGSYMIISYKLSDGSQKTESFLKGVPILIP